MLEKEMLNTLKSIDTTLKRIEQNQMETIKEAVSRALIGEKYDSIPKDAQ